MPPGVCSTQKDPPYKAILRDRQHHSWPSIPLSLRRVFRRRDTPLKLAIRGGHRKRGRQPAGCPSVSVLEPPHSVSVQRPHIVKFLVSFPFTSSLRPKKNRDWQQQNISLPLKQQPIYKTKIYNKMKQTNRNISWIDTYQSWVLWGDSLDTFHTTPF